MQVKSVVQAVQPAIIIHLAASFGQEYDEAFATNVEGARHLFSALQSTNLHSRVVLAGSAAEYGIVAPEENPINENRLLRPVSVYGLTKSWQTSLGLLCAHQGQDVVIARIFNLWGPGLSSRLFAGRVEMQIQNVLTGVYRRIEVGPLSAIRDYISLDEAALQMMAITERGISGHIYHVASGQPVVMRDLLSMRLSEDGLSMDIVDEHMSLSARVGYDVPVIYADITQTAALVAGI
jgi:GDP-4-dehydro-6-deoxy-D-mannose reductase